MEIIELDLTDCSCIYEIHERIQKAFDFPEWYGKNWDALWDCMRDVFEEDSYYIELLGFHSMENDLKEECEVLFQIFERVANINPNFSYKVIS